MMQSTETFLHKVQHFANSTVAQAAPGWSMSQAVHPDLFREAAAIGLIGTRVCVKHGGQGFGFVTLVRACEILAAVDFGFAMALVNTHNVAWRLSLSAPDRMRERYLPRLLCGDISACTALTEPLAGSDFGAITTQASQVNEQWQLRGEKTWIVNARHAGIAMVFAKCYRAGAVNDIGGFLVDLSLPGVRRYCIDAAFSQTSIGTGGFVLDDVRLDDDCLLLAPGSAFKSILCEINAARTYVAAMCNAMLAAALKEVQAYGATRHTFGKPLNAHPSWQQLLDLACVDAGVARALTDQAITLIESGGDARDAAARAKVHATQTCQHHLPALLHAMGAEGLRPEHCFTRHLAAAQIAGLTDGATNLLRNRLTRTALGRESKSET